MMCALWNLYSSRRRRTTKISFLLHSDEAKKRFKRRRHAHKTFKREKTRARILYKEMERWNTRQMAEVSTSRRVHEVKKIIQLRLRLKLHESEICAHNRSFCIFVSRLFRSAVRQARFNQHLEHKNKKWFFLFIEWLPITWIIASICESPQFNNYLSFMHRNK